jgi:hypothetical protein
MCKWRAKVSSAIFVLLIIAPASAAPFGAKNVMNPDPSVEKARLVCDEFGRCWQSQPAPYVPRTSGGYTYEQYYGYGSAARPLNKWERKGFCPPGQRKKGNC